MGDKLLREWTFWKDGFIEKNASQSRFEASLTRMGDCSTVQEFWQRFEGISSVEVLQDKKITIHFMQRGVKPMWEDKANVNGGTITIKCEKDETAVIWKDLLMHMIGGADAFADGPGRVLGVSVAMKRRNNLLILWLDTTDAHYHEAVAEGVLRLFPRLKASDVNWRENRSHAAYCN